NLTGCHAQVIELFRALPRADHVRRAHLLHTLGNMVPFGPAAVAPAESRASAASTRASQPAGAGASIYALYREILLDRAEAPQIRLLALLYLRKDLTLDDVPRIRSLL